MRTWKVAIVSTLVAALVLGATLPVLAIPDEPPQVEHKPRPRMLKGEVIGIDESSFTIQAGEQDIDIKVNEGTRFFKLSIPPRLLARFRHRISQMPGENQDQLNTMAQRIPELRGIENRPAPRGGNGSGRQMLPFSENQTQPLNLELLGEGQDKPKHLQGYLKWLRQFGEEVTFDDLATGDRVIVRVVGGEDKPLAKLVLIIAPMSLKRVAGIVTGVDETTLTLEPLSETEDGLLTFTHDTNTTFIIHGTPFLEGTKAVVIYVEQSDELLAKRVLARAQLPESVE
jgi:hypothetical protein